jgi:hypothetical protein
MQLCEAVAVGKSPAGCTAKGTHRRPWRVDSAERPENQVPKLNSNLHLKHAEALNKPAVGQNVTYGSVVELQVAGSAESVEGKSNMARFLKQSTKCNIAHLVEQSLRCNITRLVE